jgi:hypothetical protein
MGRWPWSTNTLLIPFLSGEGMRSVARLIHAAIDLQAVTAAINDVDQALGVKLD